MPNISDIEARASNMLRKMQNQQQAAAGTANASPGDGKQVLNTAIRSGQDAATSASYLNSTVSNLKQTRTTAVNPLNGQQEATNQTVDSRQARNLKDEISTMVSDYNKSQTAGKQIGNRDVNAANAQVQTTTNLQNIGITKNQDGTLAFDQTKFDQAVKADTTKIADLKNTLNDLGTMTTNVATAGSTTNMAAAKNFSEIRAVETQQRDAEVQKAQMFQSMASASMYSQMGIGSRFNLYS